MARSLRQEFWNLPNGITLARIASIPVFLLFTWYESRANSLIAALIFTAAGATDFLDGWLARRRGLVTLIGKFMDPLADKLVVVSALVMLVHLGRVAAWVVIVIMAREFIITGLRALASSEGIVIAASQEGKYKTSLQIAAIAFLFLHYRYVVDFLVASVPVDGNTVGTVLLYLSLAFSLWSAGRYLGDFMRAVYRKDELAAAGSGPAVAGAARGADRSGKSAEGGSRGAAQAGRGRAAGAP
ncbi:MAG TPA: CDP-diacylglycerol--glycerol-3-phosphate 3-phosphatidyltransferase [Anaeromyxobacteraceae bacterium]|nr:CDP-diacylglycerol--glycerol-3-phosphate 3-phosphatidyltransferase [Anaeromyxobacteraceae bacterium]